MMGKYVMQSLNIRMLEAGVAINVPGKVDFWKEYYQEYIWEFHYDNGVNSSTRHTLVVRFMNLTNELKRTRSKLIELKEEIDKFTIS